MSLVGKPAPEFTLPNQDRQPVALREEWSKGPVILAFFPAAFSSVCTSELCTLRDRFAALAGSRARVFGVSVDSFFALAAKPSKGAGAWPENWPPKMRMIRSRPRGLHGATVKPQLPMTTVVMPFQHDGVRPWSQQICAS